MTGKYRSRRERERERGSGHDPTRDLSRIADPTRTALLNSYKIKLLIQFEKIPCIPCSLDFLFIAYIFILKRFSNLFLHSDIIHSGGARRRLLFSAMIAFSWPASGEGELRLEVTDRNHVALYLQSAARAERLLHERVINARAVM